MRPRTRALLAAALVATACADSNRAPDASAPALVLPALAADSFAPGGRPAAPAGTPAPPSPLPARDPARIDVILRGAAPRKAVDVAAAGAATLLEDRPGGRTLRSGNGVAARLEVSTSGALLLDGSLAGATSVRLVPPEGKPFLLDRVAYAGELSVSVGGDGALALVNRAPLDDYLAGVLAGELFPDAPPEALRALAILARSFALSHLDGLTDDPGLHQAYRGAPTAAVAPLLRGIVAATAGLRLVAGGGGPLPGYWYHSTCGGHSADASFVFGVAATTAYAGVPCTRCTESKYYRWEIEIPEADMRRALRFGSPVAELGVGSRSLDGRVLAFRATAVGGTVRYVNALQVRVALGVNKMRSTLVTAIRPVEGSGEASDGKARPPKAFVLEGRGWGHGVGLCQIGACALAKEGRSAEQILSFYYPATRVVRSAR
jgi:stage II sporulation protein D